MIDWVREHPALAGWLVGASVVTLIGTMVLVPFLIARMRPDYFLPDRDEDRLFAHRHPVVRWTGIILKNVFGSLLFLFGLVMLATPGQGLITMFVGLLLMDFPGKRELERRLIRMPGIRRAIDWIRQRAGREPLRLPKEN